MQGPDGGPSDVRSDPAHRILVRLRGQIEISLQRHTVGPGLSGDGSESRCQNPHLIQPRTGKPPPLLPHVSPFPRREAMSTPKTPKQPQPHKELWTQLHYAYV